MSSITMDNSLNRISLTAARTIWILITVGIWVLLVFGVPIQYEAMYQQARDLYAIELLNFGLSFSSYAAFHTAVDTLLASVFLITGIIIARNRFYDLYLLLISISSMAFGVLFTPTLVMLTQAKPELTLPVAFIRTVGLALSLIAGFYLFPNGKFVPGFTRWLAIVWVIFASAWFLFPELPANLVYVSTWSDNLLISFGLYGAAYLSGVLAQVYRFKHISGSVQRQQTKWVVFGMTGGVVGFLLYFLPLVIVPALRDPGSSLMIYEFLARPVYSLTIILVPISITVSILRFRLWDVDRLINRSLVYTILTIILALIYFGAVIFLRSSLLSLTQYSSTISTIASTLAIAALFTPLRNYIQEWIDKQFFRKKYDTELTLERFRRNLRNRVDINHLSKEIIEIVDETIQPEHISLWLAPTASRQQRDGRFGKFLHPFRNVSRNVTRTQAK